MEQLKCQLCGKLEPPSVIALCCNRAFCASHQLMQCPACGHADFQQLENSLLEAYFQYSCACHRCEDTEAEFVCLNCAVLLCQDCTEVIHSAGVYKRHNIKPCIYRKVSADNLCQAHRQEIQLFCTEDWQPGCTKCMDEHKEHPVLRIEDAVKDTVRELTRKVQHLQGHRQKLEVELQGLQDSEAEVTLSTQRASEQVEAKFQRAQELLAIRRQEMLTDIKLLADGKLQQVAERRGALNENILNIETVSELIRLAVKLPGQSLLSNLKLLSTVLESYSLTEPDVGTDISLPELDGSFSFADIVEETEPRTKPVSKEMAPSMSVKKPKNVTPRALEDDAEASRKFTAKYSCSSSIKLAWTPCNSAGYVLEYGIGAKVGGFEMFRQVYKGRAYNCIITDLLPRTTYRFRVAALVTEEEKGPWSEIYSASTTDLQAIDEASMKGSAVFIKRGNEKWIQLDKGGLILGKVPYSFGKHSWDIKIVCNNIFATDDQTGSMKVGVCSAKSKNLVGLESLYYSVKNSYRINVQLDVDAMEMVVRHEDRPEPEIFSLGDGPFLPALQHKPAKTQRTQVKVLVKFSD